MPTYHDRRLKPCRTCGTRPVLEHWSSGGPVYAVRCDNPDRPESCDEAFYYSKSRDPEKAIAKWNEFQTRPEITPEEFAAVLEEQRRETI